MINTKKEYKGVAYPMKFQPYLFNTLPNGLKIDYLGSAFDKDVYQVESSKKEKRRILITQNNVRLSDRSSRPTSNCKPRLKSC